ncbi:MULTISPECIES: SH3 domain-containing C40 family peptidase [unclassified Paenibacillus]|uniref:C40 family peptidase n=1 Tax=unclassified Paenibacillus TaxID=185978 RepID=UPI001AE8CD63|nr:MULTISPECIES: SH3 domain-containing C40 family peptidase [unclassified Paenibacillus]MBP1157569.1 cell wall-associated NlpC family hydrolase [Paenibacillus sp. PvP091]MBP1171694.1 cell wall-associated NlpC family hydrolase [Paenibacillus sp. PvR098]MBP2438075.1 cell wall-associated NlpC family hydrolase [Paenibacillus sp. PvP052]
MILKKQYTAILLATTITLGIGALPAEQAHAATDAVIVSSVNFRSQPNVNSASYGYLKKGENVDIVSKVNNWWYKVRDDGGKVGYVSTNSKYIRTSSSGSGGTSSKPSGSSSTSSSVSKVIAAGKKYMGTPYEFASSRSNTRTFDCSDFVRQAFKDGVGVTLPSDSRGQASYVKSKGGTTSNWRNLKAGDLMFFMNYRGVSSSSYPSNKSNQRVTHVGIYLGDGKILHTYSKESGGVRIDTIAGKHWEKRFIFGGSAL